MSRLADGEYYDENTKVVPVVNDATIKIEFILMVMAKWYSEIVDVHGAFLHVEFENKKEVYIGATSICEMLSY